MSIEKVLYRAHAQATGGRDGRAVSSDNVLDVRLTVPREMGGAVRRAPTPNNCLPRATRPASWAR